MLFSHIGDNSRFQHKRLGKVSQKRQHLRGLLSMRKSSRSKMCKGQQVMMEFSPMSLCITHWKLSGISWAQRFLGWCPLLCCCWFRQEGAMKSTSPWADLSVYLWWSPPDWEILVWMPVFAFYTPSAETVCFRTVIPDLASCQVLVEDHRCTSATSFSCFNWIRLISHSFLISFKTVLVLPLYPV